MIERPEIVKEEHLTYLDDLRESGATNMFGAASYLADTFPEIDRRESRTILAYWMDSFEERHSGPE